MLTLREIKLNNFLSHKDTELKFEENERLLVDGRSGAGKSTITDALVWALYGTGRVANKSLIKRGEKRAEVTVVLFDDKTSVYWKITRATDNKGKHTLTLLSKSGKNWMPAKVLGLKDTQNYIEKEILHSSYILFVNSIVHLQDNIDSFVKQTSAKRKDIILEIIGSAEYDRYYDLAKDKLTVLNNRLEIKNFTIQELKSAIEGDKEMSLLVDIFKNKLELAAKHKEEVTNSLVVAKQAFELIQAYSLEYSKHKLELANNQKEIERLNVLIGTAQDDLKAISIIDLSRISVIDTELGILYQERDKIASQQVILNKWMADYMAIGQKRPVSTSFSAIEGFTNNSLIGLLKQQEEIKNHDTYLCPNCQTPIKKGDVCPELYNNDIEGKIKELTDKLEDIKKEKEEYNRKVAECDKAEAELGAKPQIDESVESSVNNRIRELTLEKDNLQAISANYAERKASALEKLAAYSRDVERITNSNKELEEKIEKLKIATLGEDAAMAQLTKANEAQRDAEANYASIQRDLVRAEEAGRRINDNTEKINKLNEETKNYAKDAEALKLIKDAFGNNGMRTLVIDYVIPSLEDKINVILSQLSDFRVRLDTQRNGTTDTILEGLFITIINELGEELEYDSYSGGERLKIEVAISEALAEIQKMSFRILDETFIGLDQESTEGFANVIMTLQSRFSQLICISHLPQIKELFDNKVEIIKINGTSKVNYEDSHTIN
jgi:exonuclease SbcC